MTITAFPEYLEINECASQPCFNNGTCTELVNAFNCVCVAGWTGLQCQTGGPNIPCRLLFSSYQVSIILC